MTKHIRLFRQICYGMHGLNNYSNFRIKSNSFYSNKNMYFLLGCFDRKFSLNGKFISLSNSKTVELNNVKENNINENSVIYCGALTTQVKFVKIFSFVTSIPGILIQPVLLDCLNSGEYVSLTISLGLIIGLFTFVSPFLIHKLTKRYVTEIRYNSQTDTYSATTLSFFLKKLNVEFKVNDVIIPDTMPIFTTMLIKGKPMFIDAESFLLKNHYIQLMGYDKPMDLKLATNLHNINENSVGKNKNVVTHEKEN